MNKNEIKRELRAVRLDYWQVQTPRCILAVGAFLAFLVAISLDEQVPLFNLGVGVLGIVAFFVFISDNAAARSLHEEVTYLKQLKKEYRDSFGR